MSQLVLSSHVWILDIEWYRLYIILKKQLLTTLRLLIDTSTFERSYMLFDILFSGHHRHIITITTSYYMPMVFTYLKTRWVTATPNSCSSVLQLEKITRICVYFTCTGQNVKSPSFGFQIYVVGQCHGQSISGLNCSSELAMSHRIPIFGLKAIVTQTNTW